MPDESGPDNPPRRVLPEAPSPSATHEEIQVFIADFLQCISRRTSRSEAEEKASRIEADGERIYEMTREEWKDQLNWSGVYIYDTLRKSDYGFYRMGASGRLFKIVNAVSFSSASVLEHISGRARNPYLPSLQSPSSSSQRSSPSSATFVKEMKSSDGRNFLISSKLETRSTDRGCGKSESDVYSQLNSNSRLKSRFSHKKDSID